MHDSALVSAETTDRLRAVVDELVALCAGPPSEGAVLDALASLGTMLRLGGAIGSALAAEVAERSSVDDGTSLTRRFAARSPAALVAEKSRVDASTASAWTSVGTALAPRLSLLGETLPPAHLPVAAAVARGAVDATVARSIISTVNECTADSDEALAVEAAIVQHASTLAPRDATRLCREVLARWSPDDADLREQALHRRRSLTITKTPDGMTRIIIDADPEATGYLMTALDARTAPRRQPAFRAADKAAAADDTRTLAQRRLDALVDMARESIQHDTGQVAGSSVTMLVSVSLETLQTGLGTARIFGVDEPIGPTTARRLAASANIIPALMGADSEPLDLGAEQRLFSSAQRRAMALRDGGCAWPGCDAPPGWTEAAHVHPWWQTRETDLRNGILLCRFHHCVFDRDGWSLEWHDGVPWFTPPAWVDASRTPRRGGRMPQAA